jgi:hypothetical protein
MFVNPFNEPIWNKPVLAVSAGCDNCHATHVTHMINALDYHMLIPGGPPRGAAAIWKQGM